MRVTRHGLLLCDARRIALLQPTDGQTTWGPIYPGKPKGSSLYEVIKLLSAPAAGDSFFIWTSRDNISRIDLRSGAKKREYPLESKDGTSLQSPIFVHNSKVYFSTPPRSTMN